jgi:hypothetical protein
VSTHVAARKAGRAAARHERAHGRLVDVAEAEARARAREAKGIVADDDEAQRWHEMAAYWWAYAEEAAQ